LHTFVPLPLPFIMPSGRVGFGHATLQAGTHRLRLEIVGKNSAATPFRFGLDCLEFVA